MSKKNIHQTGALGAILNNKGLLTAEEILTNKEHNSSLSKTETFSLLAKGKQLKDFVLINIKHTECTPWKFANRSENELGDIKALAESLKTQGQQEPILVRKIDAPPFKYEIIFGRRRFEAAKLANIDLIAICKEISDQEAAIAQKAENEHRKSISPYSEAMHYKKLLTENCFKSESELARVMSIPKTTFNNLMSFNKIPKSIIDNIQDIHNVSIRIAVAITVLLGQDKKNNALIAGIAHKLGTEINSAKQLLTHIKSTKDNNVNDTESIVNNDEDILITIKHSSKNKSIKLSSEYLKKVNIDIVKGKLMELYES